MRKLILQMGISMDGMVAAPNGSHPWGDGPEDPAAKSWKLKSYRAAGAHLMGRVTYQDMSRAWPNSEGDYADVMNEIPKVVFSKTLRVADWPETRIARGDLAEEVEALKREPGPDLIAHGGASFARELNRLRLVDEYRLTVHPAAFGAGMPIFDGLEQRLHLELLESNVFRNGVAGNIYRPRPPLPQDAG
jgi:dihydrofolate reductase